MVERFRQFVSSDDGATAVEYAFLLSLILMMVVAAVQTVGTRTSSVWQNNTTQVSNVIN